MNPLLENFFKRPSVIISIVDEFDDTVTHNSNSSEYNAWLESLVENVDYQVDGQKFLLNPNSEKIKKIHSVTVNEPLKNLDTSVTDVKDVTISSIINNLVLGNLDSFEVTTGSYPIFNITLKGDTYKSFQLNGAILFSLITEKPNPFANTDVFEFNPTGNNLPLNNLESFLNKAVEAKIVSIPEVILNSINNEELKTLIQAKAPSSSYYYYGGDLVGNEPPVDYKYFFNAVDTDWNNLDNWFEDAEGLIPCLTVPNVGDSVYIPNESEVLYNGLFVLRNNSTVYGSISASKIVFAGNSNIQAGGALTVVNPQGPDSIIFTDNSRLVAVSNIILPENTFILFTGTSRNQAQLAASDIRFSGSSVNSGSIYSPAKFYEYASNLMSVYGNAYFYDASYNSGTIYSSGYFYNYAQNKGSVFSGAEFDGFGFNQSEYQQIQPTILFYNEINKQGNRFGGCLNSGNISGVTSSTVFRSSAVNIGTTFNDTYCFDNTRLYSIDVNSNKDLYLYDNSDFFIENGSMSRISGNIFKHFTTLESLSSYVSNSNSKFIAFSQNLSSIELQNIGGYDVLAIYGGVSAQEIILTNCNVDLKSLLIGNVTFNTIGINNTESIIMQSDITRGNKGEIRGNATFNGYSYNWRQRESHNGNGITSYPMPSDYPQDIKELRGGWITGNVTFNDNSVNGGAITGNATFNNESKNIFPYLYYGFNRSKDGLVKGDATFNGLAALEDNKGIVEGLSTIN